ncbi:flagellar biosynthesis protein FlhA [Ammoniphilus oxalaticus]|uniref:Flagellar biosynthesis protein FlhA n=1 Tax=Ammoniphilus oxalaticus TaxID=66863 RepID=A0A419SJS4_9BACL|nr:flagellar biosynthesis protein FlhA [Ammoniphilus oxalaticus]RKD24210.1 flagellar biosynthesis protein FlhA [Ammoniphilus oxalaticus]
MKAKDLSILAVVIMIVVMMVIPLPTFLLDFLLIINISVSLTILLVGMNTREPLEFSVFPSMLLLTTLFRLALNVSTTRSILKNADGGRVIETFGSFVVGGNYVVGFVIFLILIIIQFIVITKGSERVAEVAARFTLDAMPGKQMSIDADLNTGIINEHEARNRRRTVEREADFYGAMDGASKFVKGDAIAGIIIFIINVLGGFVIGMTIHDMGFAEAASTFTLLSIGDGLVSQIPALLISTATGIVVTRAASEGNLGEDITEQIFAFPKLLYVVAAALCLLGIFTPIGKVTTWSIAGLIAFLAFQMTRTKQKMDEEAVVEQEEGEIDDVRRPENVVNLLQVDPLEFEFGYGLIPLADANQGGDLLDRIVMIRRQFALDLGFVVPVIRIRDNIQLQPNQYVIKLKGNEIAAGEIMLDHYLAMSHGLEDDEIVGIDTVEPAFGMPALWVNEEMKERAEMLGYTIVDPPSVVATHLTEVIKKHAHEILTRQATKQLLDHLQETHASLVEELVPNQMSVGEVQKVLQNLLREKVSIRDLTTIVETLADYAQYTKNPQVLTEYARQALARQITQQFSRAGEPLQVLTAGADLEKKIADSIQQTEQGQYLAMDPETTQRCYEVLEEQIQRSLNMGNQPILVTGPTTRMYIRQLVERIMPDVPVLSYNELLPDIEVQNIGVVNL